MKIMLSIVLLAMCLSIKGVAQQTNIDNDSLSRYLIFDEASPFGFLVTYFPPFFIQHEIELKSFIRSKTFFLLRQYYGDMRAIDVIFIRAMEITNDNTAISLLLSAVACIEHRTIGLKVPVFALVFPLTNESQSEFNRRVKNLPAKIYSDTPRAGDSDKLQHFFGSAFLTYVFESRQSADRIGEFIENGEKSFLIEGALDERDRRANHQGQEFGIALLEDNHRLPSDFFGSAVAMKPPAHNQSHVDTSKSLGDKP